MNPLERLDEIERKAEKTVAGFFSPDVQAIMVELRLEIEEARISLNCGAPEDARIYRAKARAYLKALEIIIAHLPRGR